MSGNYSNNDFSDVLGGDGSQETGKGLRSQLEQVLEQNRLLIERLNKQDREKATASLFKEKGLDPKIGELMGDADPEKWLAKFGNLFAPASKKLDESETPEQKLARLQAAGQANQGNDIPDQDLQAEREAYEAMTGIGAPAGAPSASQDLMDKLVSFDNEADLLKFMGK